MHIQTARAAWRNVTNPLIPCIFSPYPITRMEFNIRKLYKLSSGRLHAHVPAGTVRAAAWIIDRLGFYRAGGIRRYTFGAIGLGEKKTPNPFIVACDKFIFLEILNPILESGRDEASDKDKAISDSFQEVDKATLYSISATIEDLADDDGWAYLGDVGNLLIKRKPEFDPRNYGYSKLTPMLKALKSNYEIDERKLKGKNIKHVYVRLKK